MLKALNSTEGLLLVSRGQLVPVQSYDIQADGTFTVAVNPGNLIEEQIDRGTTTVEVPVQILLVFKDRTELESEETLVSLTFTKAQAGLRLEPSIVSAEPSAEYAYDSKEEARYLVKVKMFDQADTRVVIATAGATVSGSVAQPKYLQSEDIWVLRVAVGALHHAYVDYVYRFAVDR